VAHVRKGMLIPAPEWWKHLRSIKRQFWKAHRLAEKREVANEIKQKDTDDANRDRSKEQ
jgi:hypothetical protein